MKMLSTFLVLFSAVSAFAAQPEYICTGGTGDVTITVLRQGVLSVGNSECSVTLAYSRGARNFSSFRAVQGSGSDPELCGYSAIVSSSIFQLSSRVEMILQSGESAGRYDCRLSR